MRRAKAWLRRQLRKRPPQLVIPTPVLGPTREQLMRVIEWERYEVPDEHFLFGCVQTARNQFILRLPADPLVMASMYQGIRAPREGEVRRAVSYDADTARRQLMRAVYPNRPAPATERTNVTN